MIAIQLSLSKAFAQGIENLKKKSQDMTKELTEIGDLVMSEWDKNFESEGRPARWKETKQPNKILQKSLSLRMSLTKKSSPFNLYKLSKLSINLGTILPYANLHKNGGYIQAWGKTRVYIDKRDMTYLPPDVNSKMENVVLKSLKGAVTI